MMVDEADMDPVGGGGGTHGTNSGHRSGTKRSSSQMDPASPRIPSKRKPGPIPRHVVVRRPTSPLPLSSPDSSPSWLSPDPPPPLLTPVTPTVLSEESDRGEALLTCPDLEGSEPPKLTTINGDLGKLQIRSHRSHLDTLCSVSMCVCVCVCVREREREREECRSMSKPFKIIAVTVLKVGRNACGSVFCSKELLSRSHPLFSCISLSSCHRIKII